MVQPFVDRCIFQAATGGTVDFVEVSAVTGFQTIENADGADGQTLHYAAQSTDLSQWEVGSGTWDLGTTTLSRDVVFYNSLGTTAKINFAAAPQVLVTALTADFAALVATPGAPVNAVQFNNPLGTFDGDAAFTWDTANAYLRDQGSLAIGNYAPSTPGQVVVAPGDVAHTYTEAYDYSLLVDEEMVSATNLNKSGIVVSTSAEAASGTSAASGLSVFSNIGSTSVGNFSNFNGLEFYAANYGSGNLSALYGITGSPYHYGAGTLGSLIASQVDPWSDTASGAITNLIGYDVVSYGAGNFGPITNVYGIRIGDFSGIGSTISENIRSAGDFVFAAVAADGGSANVFKGRVAIGNRGTADGVTLFPANTIPFNVGGPFPLALGNLWEGDLSTADWEVADLISYSGYKHTGIVAAYARGHDFNTSIGNTSTGPFQALSSIYGSANNFGAGDVDQVYGLNFVANHSGAGNAGIVGACFASISIFGTADYVFGLGTLLEIWEAVTTLDCVTNGPNNTVDAAVTNWSGLHIYEPSGGGSVTNLYGILVEDHSAIGSTISENIRSAGDFVWDPDPLAAGSANIFKGRVAIGNTATATGVKLYPANTSPITANGPFPLAICNVWDGDLSTADWEVADLIMYSGYKHTGTDTAYVPGTDFLTSIADVSTGPFEWLSALYGSANNQGAGDVAEIYGLYFAANNTGSGDVDRLGCCFPFTLILSSGATNYVFGVGTALNLRSAVTLADCLTNGDGNQVVGVTVTDWNGLHLYPPDGNGTITTMHGILIEDMTAFDATGTVTNAPAINFRSKGVASRNVFEGIIKFGTATNASPEDGDVWFDGTDLKLRTGGVTKTFTVT